MNSCSMDVIVGTYEELILGFTITVDDDNYTISSHFSDHSHIGGVKAMAISNKGMLATGSTDETIKLFNLVKNKDLGSLMQHTGSLTDIRFKDSHMLTSSEDGTIIVWKASKWEAQRTLKGHKGAVCSVDVHPSGKLALSVGRDRTLRTWNLITGKCAFTSNLKTCPDRVLWSPDGARYALLYQTVLDVYDVETASVVMSIKPGTNLSTADFLEDDVVAVGGDEGKVYIYSLSTKEQLLTFNTDTNRVKAMKVCKAQHDDQKIVVTASSDGFIKLWKVDYNKAKWSSMFLSQHNCGFRPTCLAAAWHDDYKQGSTEQDMTKRDVPETEQELTPSRSKKGKKRKGQAAAGKTVPVEKKKKVTRTEKSSDKETTSPTPTSPTPTKTKGKKIKNKKKKKISS